MGGPITSLWYVCMYVCMPVTKTVNFFKIGAYNFNFNYQSNGEGHLLINALGAPFWALGPLGKACQMARTASELIHFFKSYTQNWADDVII